MALVKRVPTRRIKSNRYANTVRGARLWLMFSNAWRYPAVWFYRRLGRLDRLKQRGFWSFISLLAFVFAALIGIPLALAVVVWLVELFGIDGLEPAPKVRDWLSLENVAAAFLLGLVVRWINHARERVVVESFIDYTTEQGKAVSGLSTLLVTELGRLRELYQQVTDLSVPTAVGVERQGGFNRGKEAAAFLTVSADDVTDVLEGAVASDAKIEVGPARISVGPLLAFVNRVTRGPRLIGTVHLTEAGGGPTLTAQLVGGRTPGGTWRVDHEQEPESPAERKAFLDTMVRELACRMYTQLTLKGSARWRAVDAFNHYLQLYGDSHRTPRDRARFLKQAQGRLLEAVAEDERFDLAYYNLGVIYMQLAQAEINAERQSQDATSPVELRHKRRSLHHARQEAARVAFLRAAEKNPDRWEAYYALAVTRFSQIEPPVRIGEWLEPDDPRREPLREVLSFCDQALRVARRQHGSKAAVQDLIGMAQARLADDLSAAMRSHRRAVAGSWLLYCRAERRALARPADDQYLAERARANATAALNNLALAYERRALLSLDDPEAQEPDLVAEQRRDLAAAERVFKWAIRLAGEGSDLAAVCHFELGAVLERRRHFRRAATHFLKANQIHPSNCEYAARRALALARAARELRRRSPGMKEKIAEIEKSALDEAESAFALLARPFSVAVAPHAAKGTELRVKATIEAIGATWKELRVPKSKERVGRIDELRTVLDNCRDEDPSRIQAALDRLAVLHDKYEEATDDLEWELAQLELAQGQLHARRRDWKSAEETLCGLIGRLEGSLSKHLVGFGVYAHHARALRECGRWDAALDQAAECVRRDPLNVDGRREAGRAHFALGQYQDALDSWDHALWLSPSDPYLHYEVAMCHRRLAGSRRDATRYEAEMAHAAQHFEEAQELFDGEDLDGEAWTRLWRGRIAMESGEIEEAIARLEGARHATAKAAATLLLGEAYLARDDRVAAGHAFEACVEALDEGARTTLEERDTIDAGWGDELPEAAVRSRCSRGLAASLQGGADTEERRRQLDDLLVEAEAHLAAVDEVEAHDTASALLLETRAKVAWSRGRQAEAHADMLERLRVRFTPDAQELEREWREVLRSPPRLPGLR